MADTCVEPPLDNGEMTNKADSSAEMGLLPNDVSLMVSDDEEVSPTAVKRKRLIVEDSDDEKENETKYNDSDDQEGSPNVSIKRKNRVIEDSDEEDEQSDTQNVLNTSKKVIRNLKSLCDEESSDEEVTKEPDEEDDEEKDSAPRRGQESSEEDSGDSEGEDSNTEGPKVPKEKNPSRKAKTEAENVISMIQRNARDDELTVPYHCPEQKSLKDFLESLKSSRAKLIVEEKVEIKTHKYKLLKDIPKLSNPEDKPDKTEREPPVGEVTDAEPVPGTSAQIDVAPVVPKLSGGEKFTLKGDPNELIDLETGQTYVKKTVADTMISKLMMHTRGGGLNNDPKFKPEPIPGAPLKQLKRNLECELERKRAEMIMKIMKVEKDEKLDEEEILDDEEYELDSDDGTKKKKKKKVTEQDQERKKEVAFNENEEEMETEPAEEGDEDGEDQPDINEDADDQGEDEADGNAEEEVEGEEEDEEDSESDGDDLDTSAAVGKRPLKRIVTMDDSDDEQTEMESQSNRIAAPEFSQNVNPESTQEESVAPPPLFEDIPTEPLRGFEFSATQNENELFELCSGKFTTQLPVSEELSQVEASQVKDFEFNTATPLMETQGGEQKNTEDGEEKAIKEPVEEEDTEIPQAKPNLSSSEDEATESTDENRKVKQRKKKRIFIQEDDEDSEDDVGEEEENEEDDDANEDEDLPPPALEELEEYKSFLTGNPKEGGGAKKMRVTDFIEKEAELSDSEWGSEDEDERGLDTLEDIGLLKDDDNFDGEQLRDEVGRIHMRQMANEDNRELKYLKDLILNEEEQDGQGRQRTFRWQNVNGENDDFNASVNLGEGEEGQEGNAESDDDENEANWRRIRLEREKALQENTQNVTMKTKFDAVMMKTRDIRVVKPVTAGELKENSSPSFLMQDQSKKYMNLRQSFLLRDEATLNKIATISARADGNSSASDGKGNFVFRRIEEKAAPNTPDEEPPKKRKSTGPPSGLSQSTNPQPKKRKV